MSIHDVNLASEYCDHIRVVLQGGRVQAAGAVETVLIPEVLEPGFGVMIERVAREGGWPLYWFQSCAHSLDLLRKSRQGQLEVEDASDQPETQSQPLPAVAVTQVRTLRVRQYPEYL